MSFVVKDIWVIWIMLRGAAVGTTLQDNYGEHMSWSPTEIHKLARTHLLTWPALPKVWELWQDPDHYLFILFHLWKPWTWMCGSAWRSILPSLGHGTQYIRLLELLFLASLSIIIDWDNSTNDTSFFIHSPPASARSFLMCSEYTCPLNRVSGLSFSVPGTHFSKLGANINPDLLKKLSYL